MNTEYLTHIGFLVLGLGAVLAMAVSAIKFVKELRSKGDKGTSTELKNLRAEMLELFRVLEEKVDHTNDILKNQLTGLSKRVTTFEKNCPNRNCGVDE